jgi:hypothetical protein
MKTVFSILVLSFLSVPAQADGFICENRSEDLVLKVFNHTQPELGTRNAAVMVLSDSSVQAGNKTIARFTDVNGTLNSRNVVYTARVDHRFNDSGRKGELIAGTNIGALKAIILDVDFSYARPVSAGAWIRGDLELVKRNGDTVSVVMDCARYLKGE